MLKMDDSSLFSYSESDLLGKGSFANVYLGFMKSGERVAVKVAKTHCPRDVLLAEIDVLTKCNGALNIVQMRSFNDGSIALELALHTLDDLLKIQNRLINGLDQHEISDLILDLNSAVVFLQEKNIAHRDIKPGNVMVFGKPHRKSKYIFKLGDMGVSTLKNSAETLVGSPAFLTPAYCEALAGGRRPFEKVPSSMNGFDLDAWAIGCTIYNAATATYPFSAEASNNPNEAVMLRQKGDISVIKKREKVIRSQELSSHCFDKWYAHAISKYISLCFDIVLENIPPSEACGRLTKMVQAMQSAVQYEFIELKNRTIFNYADISKEHVYLNESYPSFSDHRGGSTVPKIKLLSEDGVIEFEKLNLKKLSSDVSYFIVPSGKLIDEPLRQPSKEFHKVLSKHKHNSSAWFRCCYKEFYRAGRELDFIINSMKEIKRIGKKVLYEGMSLYNISQNTVKITDTFGKVCSSPFFQMSPSNTLQYYAISDLPNLPLKNDLDQMILSMKKLHEGTNDFIKYENFLKDVDINIDVLHHYQNLDGSSSGCGTNTEFVRKTMTSLCESMDRVYEQSSELQKILIKHAEYCVTIFTFITKIKHNHEELVNLARQHQDKVKDKLDEISNNLKAPKQAIDQSQTVVELNTIVERMRNMLQTMQ